MRSAFAMLLLAAGPVFAGDHIRFTFTGTIDTVEGPMPAPASPGDPFSVMYVFDAGTPDADPSPLTGDYPDAIIANKIVTGTLTMTSVPARVSVLNDGFGGDGYQARIEDPIRVVTVGLQDFGGVAFPDDSLPVDLELGAFTEKRVIFHGDVGPSFWEISGAITGFEREVLPACVANCNGDVDPETGGAILDISDFGCFTNRFVGADLYADCNNDGALDIQDFGCFVNLFILGCP